MKTFRAIIVTFIVTVCTVMGGIGFFLFNEGIVTIESRGVEHTTIEMINGEVVSTETNIDTTGVVFKINVVDQAVIGH